MDRRLALAIILMLIVWMAPTLLWPPKPGTRPGRPATRDSAAAAPAPAPPAAGATQTPERAPDRFTADTIWVSSPLYRLGFTTHGGRVAAVELPAYRSFAPTDSGPAQIVPNNRPLLGHRLVVGVDTLYLDDWEFRADARNLEVTDSATLKLTGSRGGVTTTMSYRFRADDYRFAVSARVAGLTSGATLLLHVTDGLRSVEADTVDDHRRFALVRKRDRTELSPLASFDPGERRVFEGPFEWVGVKSKYFLVAALAVEEGRLPFGGTLVVGLERRKGSAPRAAVTVTQPVASGEFGYQVYAGPLEHDRLRAIGHGFDDANPYGWAFLRPIIHPVSLVVVDILHWMHHRLNIAYGWVLVIFGVAVRLLLWPLNQKAMESSLRMQAVAPLIKETQDRYRNDPEKLQREMLRIYKEHKVNPFGGCLPMLLPLPVLFALFFVFDNTIAFRGVPFLWLTDLSRADPYFVIPIAMGASMYALMRLGQLGVPPNPQAKMMMYVMPVMMVVLFFRLASGLNLYYTVQNLLSLPQQYLVARRRMRQAGKT
ncbi:MAG TPA: membrane protein insertase YidC [Gemmatimonadales bacterium]